MSKWNKAEWDNNCCEGCLQPLRDCLCDEFAESDEVLTEVNSILVDYANLVKKFWDLYDRLDDETAELVNTAGEDKWFQYAFTRSLDELWCEATAWELTPKDLEMVGCGACGQLISVKDQDSNGFHDPEFCGANDELENN